MASPVKKVILIFILAAICLYISLPNKIPFTNLNRPYLYFKIGNAEVKKTFDLVLGLDLAGGSHLVFEADLSKVPADKVKDAMESARNVIEKRVNLFGVSEPVVQTSSFGNSQRIIVELPGVKDPQEATQLIGQTAQLLFATLQTSTVSGQATPSASLAPTDLTGADLSSAKVGFDQQKSGQPVVQIQFTDAGAAKFEKITGDNVGKPVAIILDNQIISAPTVSEKISGGSAVISGGFTLDQAKNLTIELNAGALPVPVKLIEEQTVGATLGAESVTRSIQAGLVGLSMVLLFMILSYGRLGLIADVALLIFGIITLALYKLIPVTLTLPGIAGFLLSVGMAVDSNILIFERFKEEKLKRNFADAMEMAFGRAWTSIRDANVATLTTAFVLANPFDWTFLQTSGPVRGFAITLALGVVISLFTGIVVSRNLLRVFIKEGKQK